MGRSSWRKKKKRRKLSLSPRLLATVALAVGVIGIIALIFTGVLGPFAALQGLFTVRGEAMDTDAIRVIDGDYTIDVPGKRLENVHIRGTLFLAPAIGEGSIDLVNVTVEGPVLVQGGGQKTVFLVDCQFGQLKVNRPEGRVRLVASGTTTIESTALESGTRLVENLAGEAKGFRELEILSAEKIELSGNYESVFLNMREAHVEFDSQEVNRLVVGSAAGGALILVPDGMVVRNLQIDGPSYLVGQVEAGQTVLSASGITALGGVFERVRITAEAGQFDLKQGSTLQEVVVTVNALNNTLTLEEDVTISFLGLNEAAVIKGLGRIEKVFVNAPGSSFEQIPDEIEFGLETSVMIAGHEITNPEMLQALQEYGDPHRVGPVETEQQEEPQPGAGQDQPPPGEDSGDEAGEETDHGEADPEEPVETPPAEEEPGDGEETNGSEAENETEQKRPGFSLYTIDPRVDGGQNSLLIPSGKVLVYVSLETDNPTAYKVKIGDTELRYLPEVEKFYGFVQAQTEDELQSQVKIIENLE